MRNNTYRSNHYQARRQANNRLAKKQSLGKKIIEQFLTQLTLCALVIGILLASRLLGLKNMDYNIDKVKSAITYSPSLAEIKNTIVRNTNSKDGNIETLKTPEIIIEEIK